MSTTVPTVHDLTKTLYVEGVNVMLAKRDGVPIPMVTDGMKPRRPPVEEGLYTLTPEQLLSLTVHTVSINGRVVGYQRELDPTHARKIARKMRDGQPMPPITLALDGKGRCAIVDGQHRVVAAVIARLPLQAVIKRMTKEEQQQLFVGQRNAKSVDRNTLVLADHGPFGRYVQDAVCTTAHPWHPIVSANRHSKTKIGPFALYQLLIRYVGNAEGQGASHRAGMDQRWDQGLADELAPLIICFGNKQTNPLAFRPYTLQAIGAAAMWVFRRNEPHAEDFDRWQKHMPAFPFADWPHLRTQIQMTGVLLDHWNKRLSESRRVYNRR
jgi:hypothetical protein